MNQEYISIWNISQRLMKKANKKTLCAEISMETLLKYCFLQILLFWILHQIIVDKWKKELQLCSDH